MNPASALPNLAIGLLIGLSISLSGGLAEYLRLRLRPDQPRNALSTLLLVGLGNFVIGNSAIALSYYYHQSLWPAIYIGIGVLSGFALGFITAATLWIWKGS